MILSDLCLDIQFGTAVSSVCHLHFVSNVFHCYLRYCADVDNVCSVTPAYILQLCKPTDSELLRKARVARVVHSRLARVVSHLIIQLFYNI